MTERLILLTLFGLTVAGAWTASRWWLSLRLQRLHGGCAARPGHAWLGAHTAGDPVFHHHDLWDLPFAASAHVEERNK